MAKCRECKRSIRWIEVADGNFLKWIKVDPRLKPYVKHECKEKQPERPRESRLLDEPWWTK